jgi:hypothetical protein
VESNKHDIENIPYKEKSFCVLPWIHLATHPIGTVTPCCITDMENDMSTAKKDGFNMFLNKDKLEDIANSDLFKDIRKQMMKGEYPSACKTCYFYEKSQVYSKRMESNLKFKEHIEACFNNTLEDGTLKQVDYRYIELRLGTVCNLKCVTCNPFSSNRWNEDVSAFKGTEFEKSYFKCDIRTEWYRDTKFYDELLTKCEYLEEVWINGGEPTLIREHGYFLQKLIELGKAKDVNLHYSINMTSIPDDFIKIWKQFKQVRLHLSIDDLEERNDYIRYGSKWDVIFSNFKKILEYKDTFTLEVCQTVSILNVMNIDNFKKFCLDHEITVAHNYVHHPALHHVAVLPAHLKKKLLNSIQYLRPDEKKRLVAELEQQPLENTFQKFQEFTKLLDIKRNIKIHDYLEEWKTLI